MANTKILYLEAAKREFVDRFLSQNPSFFYRMEDGKIDSKKRMLPDPPWAYIKQGVNQNCQFWHHVLFDFVHQKKKVPIPCHNCWKVVLMPRDIEELFASYILIHELGRPGKCGIEGDRPNTNRFYGAYFYNNSLDEGLECYKVVREAVDRDRYYETTILGSPIKVRFGNGYDEPVKVILKRACTEFEQNCGPSNTWAWDEEQAEVERIAASAFTNDVIGAKIGEAQLARLAYLWIHKAFQWGDDKYLMFTNGNRMYQPPVTYHDMDPDKLEEVKQNGKKCPQ
jgi:hypothetical protein